MKNKLELIEVEAVFSADVENLGRHLVFYDRGVESSANAMLNYVFLAGCVLQRAKDVLNQGEFMPFVKKFLPHRSHRMATRYMTYAEETLSADPAVGKLDIVSNLLLGESVEAALPALDEREEKILAKAIHKATDGKSITEICRGAGVIREVEKPKHHPRKPVSPAEELDAQKAHSLDLANAVRGPIRVFLAALEDEESPLLLDHAEWQSLLDIGVELTTACRARLHRRRRAQARRSDARRDRDRGRLEGTGPRDERAR